MLGACSHPAASGFFHLYQCHRCPQPLGSLARGRHGALPGILQVYPCVCCIQVVFNIYINIYIKSQLSIFILFAFYIHGNNVYQLFFSDIFLFLSGAVYSFKQKKRWHKSCCCLCRGLSSQLSRALPLFPLPPGCVTLSILFLHGKDRRCPGTEDQYQVTQACTTWQTACF